MKNPLSLNHKNMKLNRSPTKMLMKKSFTLCTTISGCMKERTFVSPTVPDADVAPQDSTVDLHEKIGLAGPRQETLIVCKSTAESTLPCSVYLLTTNRDCGKSKEDQSFPLPLTRSPATCAISREAHPAP